MQKVILDLLPGGVAPIVYASQYDDGRSIRFMLTEGGPDNQYSLNSSDVITCNLTKPDGTETAINVANPGGGEHYVDLVNGADDYDQAGAYLGEIVLTRNTKVIGSANFVLKVEEDAYGGQITTLTATGNPCTFETNLADELQEVKCEITANQDLHGEDKPYPAGGGVNIWNEETIVSNSRLKSKNVIPVEPNKTYRYINGAGIYASVDVVNADGGYISFIGNIQAGNTFTTPADCHYLAFTVATAYGTTYNNDISINYPATDTEYHPYENICPIVGHSELNLTRCGVNLFDDAYVDNNLTAEQILPAGTYYIKAFITGSSEENRRFSFYFNDTWNVISTEGTFDDGGITWSGSTFGWLYGNATATITLTHAYKIRASVLVNTYLTRRYAIYVDNSISTFVNYNGQTFTVAFGQTIYGGVYDKSGRLTITHAILDLGSLGWAYQSVQTRFIANVPDMKRVASWNGIFVLASCYPIGVPSANKTLGVNDNNVYIKDTDYTDAISLKASLVGQMLAYELATPIVIDVSSISVFAENGVNNIVSDCGGDVNVTYIKKV